MSKEKRISDEVADLVKKAAERAELDGPVLASVLQEVGAPGLLAWAAYLDVLESGSVDPYDMGRIIAAALPALRPIPTAISDAAVEAAAAALHDEQEFRDPSGEFEDIPHQPWQPDSPPPREPLLWAQMVEEGKYPSTQEEFRRDARAALEAALPHLQATPPDGKDGCDRCGGSGETVDPTTFGRSGSLPTSMPCPCTVQEGRAIYWWDGERLTTLPSLLITDEAVGAMRDALGMEDFSATEIRLGIEQALQHVKPAPTQPSDGRISVELTEAEIRALRGILSSTDEHPDFRLSEQHLSARGKFQAALAQYPMGAEND